MSFYTIEKRFGLESVSSLGDGYSVALKWYQAYPDNPTNSIAYNIYYSTNQEDVFKENPKLVSIDDKLETILTDFIPGQLYYFGIRPIEYNPIVYDFSLLVDVDINMKAYQTTILSEDIDGYQTNIPVDDATGFPLSGVLKIGYELVEYDNIVDNVFNVTLRGAGGTTARLHTKDGYDGISYLDPDVYYFVVGDDPRFDKIILLQSRFEYPNFAFTEQDGYKQVTEDLLSTDLSGSDAQNIDFPSYDYVGWHRTDPKKIIAGECVGSYIGGYRYCADGYSGVGMMVRGISFQDANNQRQELLLESTGDPCVLLKMQKTGIVCSCYLASSEYPDDRCPNCFGTKLVLGFNQYFNPRRSDGRIMVRFSPGEDDVKMYEAGLESEFSTEVWTLTVPTIADRDILVRYDESDNEEYRYEILSVTRQRTFLRQQGGQKARVQRIRKTDPAYKIKVFSNTSLEPQDYSTTFSISNGIPLHKHDIRINEKSINNFSQITNVSAGHSHVVKYNASTNKLDVSVVLGHTHEILL